MPATSRRARLALVVTTCATALALLIGALPMLRGASADTTRTLIRVTFRPAHAPGLNAWVSDHGDPYDSRRAFGWVRDDDSFRPVSMRAHATSRTYRARLSDTFVSMQPRGARWGRWVMSVAPGTYRVSATVGDVAARAGTQNLAIEGKRAITGFQPTKHRRVRSVTVDVRVTDGRLTLDPLHRSRASRTKLVSVVVSRVYGDGPPTTRPPTTRPPTTRPPVTTAPPTTRPHLPPPPPSPPPSGDLRNQVGFAAGGVFLSGSDRDIQRELDGMRSTGATWLRLGFLWSSIEHQPGQYRWRGLDRVVALARQRGFRIVANVSYTPAWARPANCRDMMCPPANIDNYARFMGALVRHYAPLGVTTYEVWNEPNQFLWWKPRPDPRRYAEMVSKAYAAAHRATRNVTVLAGVFAPAPDSRSGTQLNPRTFLEGMYRAGVAGRFDALSFHPYSGDQDPRTQAYWNMMLSVGPDLVGIMRRHGDGAKKIWGTEMSYSTSRGGRGVTEARQAVLFQLAFETWRRQSYAGPLFIFNYRDMGTNPRLIADNYGLVKRNFTPKQALYTIRRELGR
jgi:hypothetical protein